MNKILKNTSDVLAQISNNEILLESTCDNFKNVVKKYTLIGFLALCGSISSGLATAQDYTLPPQQNFQIDVGGFLDGIFSNNSSPTNQMRMSDVPNPCNQLDSYLNQRNTVNLSVNDTATSIKEFENKRLICANQVYTNANVSAPKYRSYSAIDKTYILYEIRDYTGRYTQVTYGNSPSVSSMKYGGGSVNVESNQSLKQQLDIRAKNLMLAHEELNRVSRNYMSLSYGTDTPEYYRTRYDNNRQQSIYVQQRFLEQAYDNYAHARTDFVSMADSASVNNFNLSGYSKVLDFVSPPESTSQAYKGRPPNKYTSTSPGAFKY